MKKLLFLFPLLLLVAACATSGQNRYSWQDVGKATEVEFGRVLSSRAITIKDRNTGAGAAVGAGSGALIGAGATHGGGLETAGGALAGVIAGAIIEDIINTRDGVEYTIALRNKKIITIAQELMEGDVILQSGERVAVQTSGQYQRVLPASALPEEVRRAKGVSQYDGDAPRKKKKATKVEKTVPEASP